MVCSIQQWLGLRHQVMRLVEKQNFESHHLYQRHFASRIKPLAYPLGVSLEVNRKLLTVEVLVMNWPRGVQDHLNKCISDIGTCDHFESSVELPESA